MKSWYDDIIVISGNFLRFLSNLTKFLKISVHLEHFLRKFNFHWFCIIFGEFFAKMTSEWPPTEKIFLIFAHQFFFNFWQHFSSIEELFHNCWKCQLIWTKRTEKRWDLTVCVQTKLKGVPSGHRIVYNYQTNDTVKHESVV